MEEVHHRIRATREKLGLPRVGSGPNVRQNYEDLNGFFAGGIGCAEGLMYQPGTVNACFNAIESTFLSWDSFGTVLSRIYLPWYWSDVQVVIMDTITL